MWNRFPSVRENDQSLRQLDCVKADLVGALDARPNLGKHRVLRNTHSKMVIDELNDQERTCSPVAPYERDPHVRTLRNFSLQKICI